MIKYISSICMLLNKLCRLSQNTELFHETVVIFADYRCFYMVLMQANWRFVLALEAKFGQLLHTKSGNLLRFQYWFYIQRNHLCLMYEDSATKYDVQCSSVY